jgi:dihydroorotase
LPVTAEVTPHHLVLTDEDVGIDDASSFKMNPPLGSPDDREALLRGVLEGVIDCIATDHAPHAAELKARGFSEAPFGVVGLETAVGVTYTLLVAGGRMDVLSWLALFTTGPARVLGMQAPGLKEGAPGDLALVDPSEWTVRRSRFLSRSGNTPFEGRRLVGKVVRTFLAGRSVWNHGECRR